MGMGFLGGVLCIIVIIIINAGDAQAICRRTQKKA